MNNSEQVQELRQLFLRVDSGEIGFFIAQTGEARGGGSTYVRLYTVENNQPRDITRLVLDATGCGKNKRGDISLGGWGLDRYLTLMYNIIGFTLYQDSTIALKWAHKYYRSTL